MDVLREYYEPKKVVMAARFHFHQWQQQSGESVAVYLAELRKLAVPCEFGESLDEVLHDRLVCGSHDEVYQKCLLSERELTLDKTLQISQSMKTADVNARALRRSESRIHQLSHVHYSSANMPTEMVRILHYGVCLPTQPIAMAKIEIRNWYMCYFCTLGTFQPVCTQIAQHVSYTCLTHIEHT